jgi:hypothetical protein
MKQFSWLVSPDSMLLLLTQVHAALLGQLDSFAQQHGQERSGMGKEKAAQLLAQLPEDAVQKLLALVQQGGSPKQQHA